MATASLHPFRAHSAGVLVFASEAKFLSEESVQPKIMKLQQHEMVASESKFRASSNMQPTNVHDPSSTFAVGSKFAALVSVQPRTTCLQQHCEVAELS